MGLLDPTDPNAAMLQNIAFGLLSAGGPSRMPVGLGQAIGAAGQQGMQGYQEALQNQSLTNQNQMQNMQMQAMQRRMAFKPDFSSPNFLRDALAAGAIDIKDALPMLIKDQHVSYQDGGDKFIQLDAYGQPTGVTLPKSQALAPKTDPAILQKDAATLAETQRYHNMEHSDRIKALDPFGIGAAAGAAPAPAAAMPGFTATVNGKSYSFPSQKALANFKLEAGIQ